jgi:uncharacterized protein
MRTDENQTPIPVYQELLAGGQMWSRVIRRGQVIRLADIDGGATPAALFYNASHVLERYNMPDTLKAQHVSRLSEGCVLYSDMGRILFSILRDTGGWHDTITGHMTHAQSVARFGDGTYQQLRNGFHRNTRDNFLVELGKYGMGSRDIVPNVNFFVRAIASDDGGITWQSSRRPGAYIELRAEMNVLTILSNTPHPLDPGPEYAPQALSISVWPGLLAGSDDPCRNRCPENQRGFALTEIYHAQSVV